MSIYLGSVFKSIQVGKQLLLENKMRKEEKKKSFSHTGVIGFK